MQAPIGKIINKGAKLSLILGPPPPNTEDVTDISLYTRITNRLVKIQNRRWNIISTDFFIILIIIYS